MTSRKIGVLLLGSLLIGLSLLAGLGLNPGGAHADHNSAAGAPHGTTGGWFRGETVTFFYNKPFFCAQPPTSAATSGCEAGEDAQIPPRPGPIPTLYVLVPLGINVDPATLQCPVAGNCINHPTTIDLSRLFGSDAENVLLPPHSHVVDEMQGGWWEIEVIGVTNLDAWNRIAQGKSLAAVRAEQAAGNATPDIGTLLPGSGEVIAVKAWAGGVLGLVGGLMVAVGAVLPWVSVYGGLYQYPAAAGTAGKLMLVSGLLAASLGAVLVFRPGRLPFWGAGLAGFGALALAAYLTVRLLAGLRELAGGHPFLLAAPGYGPLVSLVGAALAFATLFPKPPDPGPNPLPAPGPTETRRPAPPPC